MEFSIVDGKSINMADTIIDNSVLGKTCLVSSYGFGVRQVERLISNFEILVLIADVSHSKLNKKAYDKISDLSKNSQGFTFIPRKVHAKLALIDDKKIIMTSANLSSNRRYECYLIGSIKEIENPNSVKDWFGDIDSLKTNSDEPICGNLMDMSWLRR